MAAKLLLALLLQSLLLSSPRARGGLDESSCERMLEHQRILSQDMTRLLEEMEQSSSASSGLGSLSLHHLWAIANGLLVLLSLGRWLWDWNHAPVIKCKSATLLEERKMASDDEEETETEEEEDPFDMGRFLEYTAWAMLGRQGTCMVIEELVNNLLDVCQMFSLKDSKPRLQPAVGMGRFQKRHGGDPVYRLLVPLKPPPGHSFHLERDTQGEMPETNARVRVELKCMCAREQWLGDVLCFLHHPEEDLRSRWRPSLLQTLCDSSSYLDLQKTIFWLQDLMAAACSALLQKFTCKMSVLPSSHYCRIKVTTNCNTSYFIELVLGAEDDNSDTFVAMK